MSIIMLEASKLCLKSKYTEKIHPIIDTASETYFILSTFVMISPYY